MKFDFANWLAKNETSTSTSCVAGFARPMTGLVRRDWLGVWAADDPFFRKERKKKNQRLHEEKNGGDVGEYKRIPDGVIKVPVPNVQ